MIKGLWENLTNWKSRIRWNRNDIKDNQEEVALLKQSNFDSNEPTGFIREFPETMGIMELCVDGSKIITIDQNTIVSVRYDGIFYDGSVANAQEFIISPLDYPVDENDTRNIEINGGKYYSIYIEGVKINIIETKKITLIPATGVQYIYHDENFDLKSGIAFTTNFFEDRPITSVLYGNSETNELITFGDERHGISMDGSTHKYLHFTQGTKYISGMEVQGLIEDGITFTQIASGKAYDEDLVMLPVQQSTAPSMYLEYHATPGINNWRRSNPTNEVGNLIGGTAQFNEDLLGEFQLTPLASKDFVIMFFFLTNDSEFPYCKIIGQKVYDKVSEARGDINSAINDLITIGLPAPEFLPIGAAIINNVGEVQLLSDGTVYLDLRNTPIVGSGSSSIPSTYHEDLLGRDVIDAHPITAITDLETELINIKNGSSLNFSTLPTTDPLVSGELWNDGGILKISI